MNLTIKKLEELTKKLSEPSKVLIIDDDQDILDIMSRMIEMEGFASIRSDSVEDAIAKVKDADLVLLDIVFPHLDGLDFLNTVRRYERVPPIVVMSGIQDEGYLRALQEIFPVVAFASKPVDRVRMMQILNAFKLRRGEKRG